jgi:hypothetical protein
VAHLEIENLEDAIAAAKDRTAAAKRAVELAAELEKARKVRDIAVGAGSRGAKIAAAARTLRDEIRKLGDEFEQMRRLVAPIVGQRLADLAMTRAISPLLREAGLEVEMIPPLQRHDPEILVKGYVDAANAWAARLLEGESERKREAA